MIYISTDNGWIILFWLCCGVLTSYWVIADAKSRGRSGVVIFILAGILLWPFGLILYMVSRPEKLSVRLQSESGTLRDCPRCGACLGEDKSRCPNCSWKL